MDRRAVEHATGAKSNHTQVTKLTRWLVVAALVFATMVGVGQLVSMPLAAADVDCSVDGDDGFEDNNSKSTATQISSGQTVVAQICGADADFFKFDVDAGDTIDVFVEFTHADGDINAIISDRFGANVAAGRSLTNNESFSHQATQFGSYDVALYVLGGADDNNYSLTVTVTPPSCREDVYEDNDGSASAAPITSAVTISAQVCEKDRDWYSIDAEAGDTVDVLLEFVHADGDLDFNFWDRDIDKIDELNSSTDNESASFVAEKSGLHYINVYGSPFWTARNSYDLTVTVTAGPRPCTVRGDVVDSVLNRPQCDALVALFDDTSGHRWTNDTGWATATDPCGWYGVVCSDEHVIELELDNNGLEGPIPSEIGDLVGLKELHLHRNALTGQIPAEIGQLVNLQRLLLHKNQLNGELPAELGNLTRVKFLYLQFNNFTGDIPAELGDLTDLTYLYLYSTPISGAIPAELGNLPNLQRLYLQSNQLSGAIPAELGNLPKLKRLWLQRNQLDGALPSELGSITTMTHLYLYDNQIPGTLPASLGGLDLVTRLYVHENNLTGSIPASIGDMASLKHLYVHKNQLDGPLPVELGGLATLERFYAYSNQLEGTVPGALGDMANLQILYLQKNNLTSIGAGLGSLDALVRFYIHENEVTALPADLDDMANLERLFLHDNQLTGDVTAALNSLTDSLNANWFRIADGPGFNNCLTADASLATWLGTNSPGWDLCS